MFAFLKSLTNCENPSDNPLRVACSGFPITASKAWKKTFGKQPLTNKNISKECHILFIPFGCATSLFSFAMLSFCKPDSVLCRIVFSHFFISEKQERNGHWREPFFKQRDSWPQRLIDREAVPGESGTINLEQFIRCIWQRFTRP
jgi:hypothetical protein